LKLLAKKFLASREGVAEGGFKGGIPPRPSVPPEPRTRASSIRDKLRGGGQFRSKKVRAFSNKGHQDKTRLFGGFWILLIKTCALACQQTNKF